MQRLATADNLARLVSLFNQRIDKTTHIQLPPAHLMNTETLIDALYELILEKRMVQMDRASGIMSQCLPFATGPVWVRECHANVGEATTASLNNNYERLFYTYLIAAARIAQLYKFDTVEYLDELKKIQQATTLVCAENKDQWLSVLANEKRFLIETMYQAGKKKLGKPGLVALLQSEMGSRKSAHDVIESMLDQTKDWVALEKPTLPVVTIIRLGDALKQRILLIVEEPCTQLTAKQRTRLRRLQEQPWYQELRLFQRRLATHYAPMILAENRVIPSQLRAVLPLQKNAWRQSLFVVDANTVTEINSYYHSGTASHLSHHDETIALKMTKANLLQLKENSQTDASVMICLNSALSDWIIGSYEKLRGHTYTADDSEIIKLTQQAAESLRNQQLFFSKICLNGFRRFEFNSYGGINALVSIIQTNLQTVKKGTPELKQQIQQLIEKIHSLQNQYADQDVKGLDIIYYLTQVARLNNELVQVKRKQGRTVSVWFGCASGENRTGIAYMNNLYQSVVDYFEQKDKVALTPALSALLYDKLANSQHVLVMTGNQGGTFGTEGIRHKSIDACKQNAPKQKFVTEYADIKSLPSRYVPVVVKANESSIGFTIGTIIMGLTGAALTSVALMVTLASFGMSTPLTLLGITIGTSLMIKAASLTAAAVGVAALSGGTGLAAFSLFKSSSQPLLPALSHARLSLN